MEKIRDAVISKQIPIYQIHLYIFAYHYNTTIIYIGSAKTSIITSLVVIFLKVWIPGAYFHVMYTQ